MEFNKELYKDIISYSFSDLDFKLEKLINSTINFDKLEQYMLDPNQTKQYLKKNPK